MFCENCGKQIPDTAAFCTGCGAKTNMASAPAEPVMSAAAASVSSQPAPVFQSPVPPVQRLGPTPPQSIPPVQSAVPATPVQPAKSYGAAPTAPAQPAQPYPSGARPGQPYGAAPGGAHPGARQTTFSGGDIISYGQYMIMMLLLCIPIANLVFLVKWSFLDAVSPNKRNFSRAVLTFMGIGILLSIFMSMTMASLFR